MIVRIIKMMIVFLVAGFASANAQRYEHRRPLSVKDQIVMKLDSIDHFYFSRLPTRERFGARHRLDDVIQLVDQLGNGIEEREQALREKERTLQERERAVEEKEHALNHNRDRDDDRGRHKEAVLISPMDPQQFDQLLSTIERTPFVQDKKKVLRTSAMSNYFMTDQVITLASKFPFDNDRIDVIETLYPRILDPDKNYLLYNCFTFSDGKNKLENFINGYKRQNGNN
jgi:hypothetical protein